ncbi:hypothetical protein O181_025425 [Austropuccinia psidii MF-1]|uniref:Uncharacterized protein n=1 Tax=Austropuccinia psidii MF-1 TaxID=1389203 RepID=A0A9Q3H147_9BASI|nr:hypothetical protein [Austropuccinia psidii MF-1]
MEPVEFLSSKTDHLAISRDDALMVGLGTIANGMLGGLTGLLGSLIWRHEPRIVEVIILMGTLAGGLGGLLHAIVIVGNRQMNNERSNSNDGSFYQVCLQVLSQAPCWCVIAASLAFWILSDLNDDINFSTVILTALAGTLLFASYAMLMSWISGSYLHLLILQNQVLVLAEKNGLYNPKSPLINNLPKEFHFVTEFNSSPIKPKQLVINIFEDNQLI